MANRQPGLGSFASPYDETSASTSSLTPTASHPSPSSPSPSSLVESLRALREATSPSRPASRSSPQLDTRTNRRAPVPSPLQHSATQSPIARHDDGSNRNNPPTRTQFARSPIYSSSPHDEPRSPREKLDALLATEGASYKSQTKADRPLHTDAGGSKSGKKSLSKAASYGQLKSGAPSHTRGHPSIGSSPPSSPPLPTMPSKNTRPDPRPIVMRNGSLDSATSSISSASQSFLSNVSHTHKSSQDIMNVPAPEMAALIAAAGSPEAAIQNMWKEKQTASAHNAQLWRLVEKQRAMILGLNKDLERALKDKERYRKKLKDHMAQVPPVPAVQKVDQIERDHSQSPALSEPAEDPSVRSISAMETMSDVSSVQASGLGIGTEPVNGVAQPFISASPPILPSDSISAAVSVAEPASKEPSPTELKATSPSSAEATPHVIVEESESLTPMQEPPQPVLRHVDDERSPPLSAIPPPLTVFAKKPQSPPKAQSESLQAPPSIGLIEATPEPNSGAFPSPVEKSHHFRKAPPAPLDLSRPNNVSSHLHQPAAGQESDSEYDDVLEVDEIPLFERGRKKTREEDDRQREVLMRIEENRSKSTKSKSKPSSAEPTQAEMGRLPDPRSVKSLSPPINHGLPASPRMTPAAATTSLNAILSPTGSERSAVSKSSVVSAPLMSPGLPSSPRPTDRPMGSPAPRMPNKDITSPLASPPMSPTGARPLSPRAPKQPIPMPPNTPLSFTSPHLQRAEQYQQQQEEQPPQQEAQQPPQRPDPPRTNSGNLLQIPQNSLDGDILYSNSTEPSSPDQIYRGLVSEQHPALLLPPNALPSIDVKVFSSRLRPSRNSFMASRPSEEDPVFLLAIHARSSGRQLWQVEKTIIQLPMLHQQLKTLCGFTGRLPERSLFSGHAPAKIDDRRIALNKYFEAILDHPMDEKAALVVCEFFSTDVIGASPTEATHPAAASPPPSGPKSRPRKEGYLTKRGKNFGGWKARFFVLDGPEFRYFESEGGAHLGTIRLYNSQIGKQSQHQQNVQGGKQSQHPHGNRSPSRPDDAENQYRHAFLILEPKRKDSSSLVRHVLCAESDDERDAWVEALLQYVDYLEEPKEPGSAKSGGFFSKGDHGHKPRGKDSPETEKGDMLQGIRYDDTVAAEAPVHGTYRANGMPSPTLSGSHSFQSLHEPGSSYNHPAISAPTNGGVIHDTGIWGNKASTLQAPAAVKDKKRSIFGFNKRSGSDTHTPQLITIGNNHNQPVDKHHQTKMVFGIPLAEAVECSAPVGIDTYLPAVVYRSLEYLQAKNAAGEEGVFRLSGSNIVIKSLRERFNSEGDVKLLDGQYYDVHAVASLLKLYLRELPTTILTRDLHLDFLKVLDEREKKIQAFNVLVHKLPRANFELIQALSSYLIEIVNNADQNKMTVRNVGIVFAPTLNIPAPLISFFLTDYPAIFGPPIDEATSPIHEIQQPEIVDPEAIRSPRKQMFTDLPTPAYNQTAFHHQQRQHQQPKQQHEQQQQQPPHHLSPQQTRPPSSFPMPNYSPPPGPPPRDSDTGFIPLRPSYESPAGLTPQQHQQMQHPQQQQQHHHAQQQQQQQQQHQSSSPPGGYPHTAAGTGPTGVGGEAGFASLNGALYPAAPPRGGAEDSRSVKAKRRESSLLFMTMGSGGAGPGGVNGMGSGGMGGMGGMGGAGVGGVAGQRRSPARGLKERGMVREESAFE